MEIYFRRCRFLHPEFAQKITDCLLVLPKYKQQRTNDDEMPVIKTQIFDSNLELFSQNVRVRRSQTAVVVHERFVHFNSLETFR